MGSYQQKQYGRVQSNTTATIENRPATGAHLSGRNAVIQTYGSKERGAMVQT